MNKLISLKKDILYLTLMLTIPLLSKIYSFTNNQNRGVYSLVTDIDRSTPFIKTFALAYISWFGFIAIALGYIYFKDKKVYLKTLLVYDICLIISFITYFLFQTTVPRPTLSGNDIFTNMVRAIYNFDRPFNCFPSIHCMSSYLMMKAVSISNIKSKLFKAWAYVMSILIMISTLLIKQHVILDLICGILLCDVVFKIIFSFSWERFTKWKRKQSLLWTMKKKLEI
jgi:membrane-associated phospholipid phosphatase